jgi:transcriptional regulator with XRE-family HTH domain
VKVQDKSVANAVARAIGEELRRARDARGWTRAQVVALLPSGIGERTLLSYEHGTRQLSVLRLLELCDALGVTASSVLSLALQRARLLLENLALQIDLHAVLNDQRPQDPPLAQWASNKLGRHPDGIVELVPAAVLELADFMGYDQSDLAARLSRFAPGQPTAGSLNGTEIPAQPEYAHHQE